MAPQKKTNIVWKSIRDTFIYGLIVIAPIFVSIRLVSFLISAISTPISLVIGEKIPMVIAFLITLAIIGIVGLLAKNFIGKAILAFFDQILARVPVVNVIYKSAKQVVDALTMKKDTLKSAVLLEYPRKGLWVLGFLTQEDSSGLTDINGNQVSDGLCAVFVPTTPNPTSGFYLYVNPAEIIRLSISVEDSVKLVMSAGVLNPLKKDSITRL